RREFVTLLGGALAVSPLRASAQRAKVYTLGVLTLPNPDPLLKALREGLRDAGYVEGDNLRLEVRSAAGRPDLQLDKATELVRLKVDLVVTFFTPSALAAKQATRDIPIVMGGRGRSSRDRAHREPCSAGRQCHRAVERGRRGGREESRVDARTHSGCASCRC